MAPSWTTQASQLIGKRPATDELEIALQAIAELTKQCAELKSWAKHLEQDIIELKRRQR
jgi:hypothetical protein